MGSNLYFVDYASIFIIRYAKKKYDFDIFNKGDKIALWKWLLVIESLIISYVDRDSSKIIKELNANHNILNNLKIYILSSDCYSLIKRIVFHTINLEMRCIFLKKLSYKIALGGVMASVCLLFMFLTAVFPLLSMAIPIYAGAILVIVAVEINSCWALLTYAASAFLCVFITPDKEAAVLFITFFGYYPILRRIIDKKISFMPVRWGCKFAVFTTAIVAAYYFIINVFGIYDLTDEFGFLGEHMILILILFAEGIFVLYDVTLAMLENAYVKWFRKTYLSKR